MNLNDDFPMSGIIRGRGVLILVVIGQEERELSGK